MWHRAGLALLLLTASAVPARGDAKDEEAVRAAGIGTTGEALLQFFRSRTLSEADYRVMEEQVKQLGSRSFAVRERAFKALKDRGMPAVPALKAALASTDIEVVRRAERCLAEIGRGPGPELPAAAIRLLAQKAPPGTVPVLIAFAPHADDQSVEEALLEALVKLTPVSGTPEIPLRKALADNHSSRRAAAAYVLGRRADAQPEVRKLLADNDVAVRFRAVQGLLAGRDRAALAVLPEIIRDAPLSLAWQAEELLLRLAGESAPTASIGAGEPEARARSRLAWEAWVKKEGGTADMTRVADVRRLLGLTLGIEYNTARIWECGPDGTIRWEIANLKGPMEAWVLPGNRVLLADGNSVTERDFKGTVLRTIASPPSSPTGCQRLPNGNTFVSSYERVMEYDREGKQLYEHQIGGSNAIRKHRNGNIIYAIQAQIIEMDTAGKKVRSIPIPKHSMWVGIEDIPGDRYLLANSTTGQVIEVDATGKVVWEANVAGACGVTRLMGGNTLVATVNRVVELDRTGKTVWEKKTTGYVRRVHRR